MSFAKGLAEDTIVVYVCDNGWIQDPDADRYAPRSKQSPNEGGLRTPIMVRWPGRCGPAMSDARVLSIDIAPTILAAVGLESARDAGRQPPRPGRRRGPEGDLRRGLHAQRRAISSDPASSLRYRWAVEGDWKLIDPARQNTPDGKPEVTRPCARSRRENQPPRRSQATRRQTPAIAARRLVAPATAHGRPRCPLT